MVFVVDTVLIMTVSNLCKIFFSNYCFWQFSFVCLLQIQTLVFCFKKKNPKKHSFLFQSRSLALNKILALNGREVIVSFKKVEP